MDSLFYTTYSLQKVEDTPSRKDNIEESVELGFRMEAVSLIERIGVALGVNKRAIHTSIVLQYRFFVNHSYIKYKWRRIALTCFYLGCKSVKGQSRKVDEIVATYFMCRRHPYDKNLAKEFELEVISNEKIVRATLIHDLYVEPPEDYLIDYCKMFAVNKIVENTALNILYDSLKYTTYCLRYTPAKIARFSLFVALHWENCETPMSSEGTPWYEYAKDEERFDELANLHKMCTEFMIISHKMRNLTVKEQ